MQKCKQNWLVMLLVGAMLLFSSYVANAEEEMMEEGAPEYEIPPEPLLIGDRLLIYNAIGQLWDDAEKREQVKTEGSAGIALETIPAASPQVFIDAAEVYYSKGVWNLSGVVYRMGKRSDGIEVIAERELFTVQAQKDDGAYRITFAEYNPVPVF